MTFLELSTAWSLQILLIGACAEAGAPLLRKAHPRIRARFWLAALLLSLAAPWLMSRGSAPTIIGETSIFTVTSATVDRAVSAIDPSWQTALLGLWGFIALIRIARLARGLGRLASITAESRPVEVEDMRELRIRESAAIQSPAASFLGRVILVPGAFHGLPETWRRAALVHESIHLRRGHGILLLVEELILAFFWFHPMVSRLILRVRDSREEVVDAETLEVTGAARDYRDMLIGLATRIRIPAPAVSGTTALGARIESLMNLEENPMPITSTPRLLVAGFTLLSAAALASAALPLGLTAQPAAAGEKKASKPPRSVVSRVSPVYPPAMKEQKVEGVVAIALTVGPDGTVTAARNRPLTREAHPELVKAAIEALRQWRFEPGKGSVEMTHTINFRLNDGAEKK